MGNWHISIRGTGIHHNTKEPADANRMAADFVQKLRDAGHHVEAAVITHGGEDVICVPAESFGAGQTPETYLHTMDEIGR